MLLASRAIKEWTFHSAYRDAFFPGAPIMDIWHKINNMTETERDEAAAMLRELDYDFL